MFASSLEPRAKRRGIVLVVVLGMLGLMALIGVTFATFAGQSLIASRNFGQGVARPQAEALMDYALAQLINDTNNPVSAIRGHSLLRDMYGNDSVFRGSNPTTNPASETGGFLSSVFIPNVGTQTLHFTNYQQRTSGNNGGSTAFYNQIEYQTNIPTSGQYYGLDFTRWIVRFPNNGNNFQTNAVPQTFEILEDDASGAFHSFTLASNLINPTSDPNSNPAALTSGDWTPYIFFEPNLGPTISNGVVSKPYLSLAKEIVPSNNTLPPVYVGLSSNNPPSAPFVLDGRYMRAFNGAGLSQTTFRKDNQGNNIDTYPYNYAAYGNFRLNGLNPDGIGMDEDYDACDLENWFLAIQSADGQVVVPSFHRPGILMATDWLSSNFLIASKILRPRQADNSPLFPTDPSVPDKLTGKLTYDIDNDGDGVTDSVWVDLGYPVQRDPVGKLYKPLFAFMVLGLNGRLPLNTVGNLQARAIGDKTNTSGGGQGGGPSVLNTNNNADATGQVPYAGFYSPTNTSPDNAYFQPLLSSQVYLDSPLWDHTSHLGFSVNEINPKYALQNAPSNVYTSSSGINPSAFGVYPPFTVSPLGVNNTASEPSPSSYTQYDNAGVSVALTQLRNILSGTVPTDVKNPISFNNINQSSGQVSYSSLSPSPANSDLNYVVVNGLPYVLPNNVADFGDNVFPNQTAVLRNQLPIAGRWGEISGVPNLLPFSTISPAFTVGSGSPIVYSGYWFNNPVRAGRSFYTNLTNDAMDDDFDAFDPYLTTNNYQSATPFSLEQSITSGSATPYQIPLNLNPAFPSAGRTFTRSFPEAVDTFDSAGQMAVASERIRRFGTPIDPSGSGRIVGYLNRPNNDYDYGTGPDSKGRNGFFRYFRTPGMPQEIRYPYFASNGTFTSPYASNSDLGQQYLMPVLLPAGQSANPTPVSMPMSISDVSNNAFHGYQSGLTPSIVSTDAYKLVSMGAMPYDWDLSLGSQPAGYGYSNDPVTNMLAPNRVDLLAPTINPGGALLSSVGTSWGPQLNPPASNKYIISYPTSVVNGYLGGGYSKNNAFVPIGGGSLNTDEADEMNLYSSNLSDQPYGPSDLEWLYRLQDVDGATLNSRLSKLAPVSFLNPADGLTRRRLFSTDSWDLNRFVYANDNPIGTGSPVGTSTNYDPNGRFTYNSRFLPNASPSLENMNQVVAGNVAMGNNFVVGGLNGFDPRFANPVATEFLPNPTFPPTTLHNNIHLFVPNNSQTGSPTNFPLALTPSNNTSLFENAFPTATPYNPSDPTSNNVVVPFGNPSTFQVQTPSIAHGDRRINLNFPLPIANDPAEPVRQKWCRETYQLLKAILPPASIDTPEELAALSQFVVNIIDFRDTDCTMTRFVNTDLEVTDVLTKQASNNQQDPLDLTWSVSPSGVRFATTQIPSPHFPYDPSLYDPNGDQKNNNRVTPFLVQHGMEYNPIAINEVFAYQAPYTSTANPDQTTLATYQAMFIELVNTLTDEVNNPGLAANASAISLQGWDLVLAPDDFGWGRPNPTTGDVNSIALPPWTIDPAGSTIMPPVSTPLSSSKHPYPTTSDPNLQNLYNSVQQFSFDSLTASPVITAVSKTGTQNRFVIGDYRDPMTNMSLIGPYADATNGFATPFSNSIELSPIVVTNRNQTTVPTPPTLNVKLPKTFVLPSPSAPSSGMARYYWLYLRRPANPFDTTPENQVRPNKEMVVVDSMRFLSIDAGTATLQVGNPTTVKSVALNDVYSAQRLQPFRGGHLVRVDTQPPSGLPGVGSPANGVKTICPPSPPYAYGYSEQISAPPTTGNGSAAYSYKDKNGKVQQAATTSNFKQTIYKDNSTLDSAWNHVPLHDRDFTSVAELLQVPGCPPGLFTKQFVEETYPGNIFANTLMTLPATGTDSSYSRTPPDFKANAIVAPTSGGSNPSLVGRQNFNISGANLPAYPTFPYLSDNFYYTAASVTPPAPGGSLDPKFTQLTTEIGGWTGAGWHKMLEFFEVPSSANGAIGTADGGNNFDWARNDLKPGLINLNLIIDEEVFAGLIDDPRANENLAYLTSSIPAVVTQIDGNGYPVQQPIANSQLAYVYGQQTIFGPSSTNILLDPFNGTGNAFPYTLPVGRGYTVRDPFSLDYLNFSAGNATFAPQQVHGIKAAFCDFLKLRHGGSGYLFAFGNGNPGSGDYPTPPSYPNQLNASTNPPFPNVPTTQATQPVAAERPYRSLSYPDIDYTVLRPASLPPARMILDNNGNQVQGTLPPLPYSGDTIPEYPATATVTIGNGLENLLFSNVDTNVPYSQLSTILAPMNQSLLTAPGNNYQYIYDPGLKNPFLPIQYVNQKSPLDNPVGSRHLAPPYATPLTSPTVTPAPFPPSIPPTPFRRLFQIPDNSNPTNFSNANLSGGYTASATYSMQFPVNEPTVTLQLSTGTRLLANQSPPTLVPSTRAVFKPDNFTPQLNTTVNNYLGATGPTDYRQHPLYRTEWLQKVMNLTTVRTHQFAVWITVGFFEVVKPGTTELGIPDILGQELGLTAGRNVRYRSFFTLDRTKATGFNPYYPGNFRDVVTYRRRIE